MGDTLEISKLDGGTQDVLSCNVKEVPLDGKNLIVKAFDLFRQRTGTTAAPKPKPQECVPLLECVLSIGYVLLLECVLLRQVRRTSSVATLTSRLRSRAAWVAAAATAPPRYGPQTNCAVCP
jgi:hypothetical protein